MEANSIPGGILPSINPGFLGLELPLHQHQQQKHQQQQILTFTDHHPQSQQSIKQLPFSYNTNKPKQQQQQQQQHLVLSDEEEPGSAADDSGLNERKRVSPWQRMKWTDNMIRLLIMVVFYIGDDGGPEPNDHSGTNTGKKKSGGGLLQKKGKWKSVSRAMMEKGFYVSPQQCEDKFNDLNKRYKRVNDILGKGTACKVVENQSLLDTMDQLSPKMKEEARKLLNSKHLFFREMCAYHNSGGAGGGGSCSGGGATSGHQSSEVGTQQHCFHSPESKSQGLKMLKGLNGEEEEEVDEDGENDDDNEDEYEDFEDEEETNEVHGDDEHENDEKLQLKKRQKRGLLLSSPLIQQLRCELTSVLQDGSKTQWERKQWMKSRSMQLEEQNVNYQSQAFELEKQRLKWVKFSGNKEREMKRMELNNERMRLENERLILLLRQKELELIDLHQEQQQQQQQQQ